MNALRAYIEFDQDGERYFVKRREASHSAKQGWLDLLGKKISKCGSRMKPEQLLDAIVHAVNEMADLNGHSADDEPPVELRLTLCIEQKDEAKGGLTRDLLDAIRSRNGCHWVQSDP